MVKQISIGGRCINHALLAYYHLVADGKNKIGCPIPIEKQVAMCKESDARSHKVKLEHTI
jgi:hypothetical protein